MSTFIYFKDDYLYDQGKWVSFVLVIWKLKSECCLKRYHCLSNISPKSAKRSLWYGDTDHCCLTRTQLHFVTDIMRVTRHYANLYLMALSGQRRNMTRAVTVYEKGTLTFEHVASYFKVFPYMRKYIPYVLICSIPL